MTTYPTKKLVFIEETVSLMLATWRFSTRALNPWRDGLTVTGVIMEQKRVSADLTQL